MHLLFSSYCKVVNFICAMWYNCTQLVQPKAAMRAIVVNWASKVPSQTLMICAGVEVRQLLGLQLDGTCKCPLHECCDPLL